MVESEACLGGAKRSCVTRDTCATVCVWRKARQPRPRALFGLCVAPRSMAIAAVALHGCVTPWLGTARHPLPPPLPTHTPCTQAQRRTYTQAHTRSHPTPSSSPSQQHEGLVCGCHTAPAAQVPTVGPSSAEKRKFSLTLFSSQMNLSPGPKVHIQHTIWIRIGIRGGGGAGQGRGRSMRQPAQSGAPAPSCGGTQIEGRAAPVCVAAGAEAIGHGRLAAGTTRWAQPAGARSHPARPPDPPSGRRP